MYLSIILLFLSTIIWGFGFIATKMTFSAYNPYWSQALRFIIAGIVGIPFLIYKKSFTRNNAPWRQGFIGGFLLLATLLFQAVGLKYTTVAKSGFITTLYSFFVPITLMAIYRKKYRATFWGLVFLALLGVSLLCNLEFKDLNIGDLWILFCSLFASFHIIYIGEIANSLESAIEYNFIQNLVIGLMGLVFAFLISGPISITPLLDFNSEVFKGMFFLSIVSSMIAFSIQVIAQQKIPSHIASLIFLMESPFAAWFGFMIYGEKLNSMNMVGAFFILLSVCLVPVFGREVTTSE